MRPVTINPTNVADALTELQTASHENDIVEIAQSFVGSNFPAILIPGSCQTFQQGNPASTTETTLASYTLPAGSLNTINQGLVIKAAGYWGNNGTEGIARLYFGSSAFEILTLKTDKSRWIAEMTVILAATGPTQEFVTAWAATNTWVGPFGDDPTIDVTSNVTIKLTGQSPVAGVANEVVGIQLIVEPLGSDLANVANTFSEFLTACAKGGVNRTT